MALVRKLRRIGGKKVDGTVPGGSLSVSIPADFVKALGLSEGDSIEFTPESRETFRIRKAPSTPKPIEASPAPNDSR